MSMFDCNAIEQRLDAMLDGSLSGTDRAAADRHLASCDACRELLRLARIPQPESVDLLGGVMTATTGSACATARDRLCDFIDRRLDGLDDELVRSHLDGCRDCGALTTTLVELTHELPLMAELAVDDRFLADVIARTSAGHRPRIDRFSLWIRGWGRLLERPRFALEAAYVMTALIVLIVGIPTAPLAGVSRRAFEIAATDLRPGVERSVNQMGSDVSHRVRRAWSSTETRITTDARQHAGTVIGFSTAIAGDIRQGVGTLWTRLASGETNNDDNRSPEESDRQEGDAP
jgi:predicted anti-sigma-YlaC factor YlaD